MGEEESDGLVSILCRLRSRHENERLFGVELIEFFSLLFRLYSRHAGWQAGYM